MYRLGSTVLSERCGSLSVVWNLHGRCTLLLNLHELNDGFTYHVLIFNVLVLNVTITIIEYMIEDS